LDWFEELKNWELGRCLEGSEETEGSEADAVKPPTNNEPVIMSCEDIRSILPNQY